MSIPLRSLLFPCLILLLSACSLLPESSPVSIYTLPASPADKNTDQNTATLDWSVRVMTPYANQTLDSTRIAVIPEANQISHYKDARWSDRAPVLLRERLIDALRSDGRIKTITGDTSLLAADTELSGELYAFQSEYHDGRPEIHIRLDAQLIQQNTRKVLASHRFEVRLASPETDIKSIVRSFGSACDKLTQEMTAWTIHILQNQPRGDNHD
ncbi:ABC-type transport auxiliary lipoprotein family protein [Tolumonas osonensis]|uniref:Cholesterol transport system auxiliary component n=1 Tax=Tolumonas osonensis TaxID=675874 RepID=A0A841GLT8_9GAMM|nr:ABC-type transport auxiliary lipoprotein family protein [Tolumonas osonensis]MBB6055750.1 cholesterol transport system auxiliary component [Tolumonas osonensis]